MLGDLPTKNIDGKFQTLPELFVETFNKGGVDSAYLP